MPLTPVAKDLDLHPEHTVHDGAMFAKEVGRKDPRSPEANRFLVDGLRLDAVRLSFVSPMCSYLQVCSDVGVLKCDWMTRRARVFHERESTLVSEEVTPPPLTTKPVTRIPAAAWTTRAADGEAPPRVPFARRRMQID